MTSSTSDPRLVSLTDPRLAALVDELTDRLQAGDALALESFIGRYPEHADQLRQLIPALEMIGELKRTTEREAASALSPGRDPRLESGVLGDYRILREVGRGGMGVVYEAEQVSLRRRVALKVLPLAATLDSKRMQRFQVEAQAAACLHHTNIVPVHAIGCERGVPFYVMQLIEGRSLGQLIAELRRLEGLDAAEPPAERPGQISTSALAASLVSGGLARGTGPPLAGDAPATLDKISDEPKPAILASRLEPDSSTRPSGELLSVRGSEYLRSVARLGLQVAEALDHAHTRGILHRDIKPANLLLDEQGQLWVTDFGLAQIQGNPGLSLTGDILGTLRYMSPEQALAKRVVIDGRTDVYSLGVTLYELLTLRPAIAGQDRQEILRGIAQEEPPLPRKLNPAVPRDLETVLLKAMAKEPSGRYATARDLADELGRFLEDKPITARRPSLIDRAAKLARRHRPVVWSMGVSLAVLLLMAVAGLATSNVLISRERDRKDTALKERETALATAHASERASQANLRLARKAVDDLYTQLAEEMQHLPRAQPLQRKFLLQALEFYKEFAKLNSADSETRFETGRAYSRVGSIHCKLRQFPESKRNLQRAIALFEKLAEEFPEQPRYRVELASTYSLMGVVLVDMGQKQQGIDAYRSAGSLVEPLLTEFPRLPDYQVVLTGTLRQMGTMPDIAIEESTKALQRAIRLGQNLVAEFPDEMRLRDDLASSQYLMGYVLAAARRFQEAESAYRNAFDLLEPEAQSPESPSRRALRGPILRGLATVLAATERTEEGERALRQALLLCEKDVSDYPDVLGFWSGLADAALKLAMLLDRTSRPKEAIEAIQKVDDCYAQLARRSPNEPVFVIVRVVNLADLGRRLAADHRRPGAREAYRTAAEIYEKVGTQIWDDPSISLVPKADFFHQTSPVLLSVGRSAEAVEAARRAVELYERLPAEPYGPGGPVPPWWRLAVSHHHLGRAMIATGRHGEAIAAYRRALELRPERAMFNNDLAWMLVTAPDQKLRNPSEAVLLATEATKLKPDAANNWNTLGVAHFRAGDHGAAIAALEKSEELGHGSEFGFNAFFLAMAHWRMGHKDEARGWYDKAVSWMEKSRPNDDELRRFYAEASTLLGLPERAAPAKKEVARPAKR